MRKPRIRSAALGLVAAVAAVFVVAAPSRGDSPSDYPEWPYPTTRYQEDNRGQFHFSSRGGWMNDINAPLYYRGVYHIFYQSNPHGLAWDTIHWGHATSTDLVHWQQQPIALEPGVQPGNLWSGGGVVDTRNVTKLKSGSDDPIVVFSNTDGVSIYYSLDGAKTFQAYRGGAKVISVDGDSRDPQVVWDPTSNAYILTVWANENGNGVNFYRSTNLLDWTYTGRYAADWLFECPQLQPMHVDGGKTIKWVLNAASGKYAVGDFTNGTFSTDWTTPQQFNSAATGAGGPYYAGLNFQNMPNGRIVSMAWQGGNNGSTWTGNATFPVDQRLVTTPDGLRVHSTPVPEISSLYTGTQRFGGRTLNPKQAGSLLNNVNLDLADIDTVIDTRHTTSNTVTLRLHTLDNGWSDADVTYDVKKHTLDGVPLPPRPDGTVEIRMLVDRGQLDLFGNDGAYYRSRNLNFDSMPGGPGMQLVTDGRLALEKLDVHTMKSSWVVGESTFHTNITDPWYPVSGTWSDASGGKQGTNGGDAFYLSTRSGTNFTYEGDVNVLSGTAAALTMRANRDATQQYSVNIDVNAGVVKLWRPGRDIATYPTALARNHTYHLKVQVVGDRFQVWFDNSAQPVIDATDDAYGSGQFGINMFNGTALIQNVNEQPLT
jgi:sucrose-6-phosphate hydrolase SacC (GH32 family)